MIILRPSSLLLLLSIFVAQTTVFAKFSNIFLSNSYSTVSFQSLPYDIYQSTTMYFENTDQKLAPSPINLLVSTYQSRIAQLTWNATGLSGYYFVERLPQDSTVWVRLKKIPYTAALEYNDTISWPHCDPLTNFTYRIIFKPSESVNEIASQSVDISLSDRTSPADVSNLNVSIINNNGYNPRITWNQLTGDAIKGYLIQRFPGNIGDGNSTVLDTIPNDSIGHTDITISDVCDKSYKYVITAIDKCKNVSNTVYEDSFVQSIKLDIQQPGACDKIAKLSWNSYHAMPGGLYGYKIYRSDPMGATMLFETKETTYEDNSDFVKGHTYYYSVTALSKNKIDTSSSCQATWKSNLDVPPEVYITQASVEANSFVRVSYHITPPSTVLKLILERSDNGTTNFQPVDSLVSVLGSYVPEDLFIDDPTARVQTQSYYYRLVAYDDCNKTKSYNIARSILLQGFTDQKTNTLNWNSYETWNQGVERYTIYRILDGDLTTPEFLGTTDPTRLSYVDLLSGVDPAKAVCYWVVANEISTTAISQSNTFCIPKDPILFMPNAFYPDGINHLLRPVPKPAFVDVQSFKMTIFNRWGQQLFETTDITTGWDGVINGQNAPAGLYTYLLNYKSLEGKEYTKRGTAALVR